MTCDDVVDSCREWGAMAAHLRVVPLEMLASQIAFQAAPRGERHARKSRIKRSSS